MYRNYIVIAILMVFLLLANMPLSSGYDFIGDLPRRSWRTGRLIEDKKSEQIEEETVVEEPEEETTKEEPPVELVEESVQEEPVEESVIEEPVIEEESVVEEEPEAISEPEKPIEKEAAKPITYIELDYDSIDKDNPMKSLPSSESGNYIVVYSTDNCPYCEKLIAELKADNEAYILVVIRCQRSIIDLYYNRFIYNFPSWVIISKNKVTYYGRGYYSVESFKRML